MFKKLLATVGFVIEGRDDDELPECVIGLAQICYPDPVLAIQAAEFFAGTAPRSFEEPPKAKDSSPAAAVGASSGAAKPGQIQPAAATTRVEA